MSIAEQRDTGWRGSREVWLGAAYDALIEQGIDAVKIQSLGARMLLSRTSFYWFFKDRADLLDALIGLWDGRTTEPLIAASNGYADSETEAMLAVIATFLTESAFDSRLEFAVRGWALQDAAVLARLRSADTRRLTALAAMMARWGHAPEDADVRARTVYLTQIGYIAMQTVETLETRLGRIAQYVQIFTGRTPSERDMARFRARLGL